MNCPSCSQENPDSASFCGYCGVSLQSEAVVQESEPSKPEVPGIPEAVIRCTHCGGEIRSSASFCEHCGASRTSLPADQSVIAPQAADVKKPNVIMRLTAWFLGPFGFAVAGLLWTTLRFDFGLDIQWVLVVVAIVEGLVIAAVIRLSHGPVKVLPSIFLVAGFIGGWLVRWYMVRWISPDTPLMIYALSGPALISLVTVLVLRASVPHLPMWQLILIALLQIAYTLFEFQPGIVDSTMFYGLIKGAFFGLPIALFTSRV